MPCNPNDHQHWLHCHLLAVALIEATLHRDHGGVSAVLESVAGEDLECTGLTVATSEIAAGILASARDIDAEAVLATIRAGLLGQDER